VRAGGELVQQVMDSAARMCSLCYHNSDHMFGLPAFIKKEGGGVEVED